MIGFDALFCALHGFPPFPWQQRLAKVLADLSAGTEAPDLDISTGLGKTAGLSTAWLWALASDVERNGPTGRGTPIRLVHVAPRRSIVDDAVRTNLQIAMALRDATDGSLVEVAALLRSLSDLPGHPGEPLAVANLQGGHHSDLDWRRRADVPTVIVSTEDQALSGLLFRSYLSSSSTKPMVAGLLGVDAGWVMDESHLMEPSVHAVEWCLSRQAELSDGRVPRRSWIIRSSATRDSSGQSTISLDDEDRSNAVIKRRIGASKTIVPRRVAQPRGEPKLDKNALSRTFFLNASNELLGGGAQKLMVVCHTVTRARDVHQALREVYKEKLVAGSIDIELLHGQQRQTERDQIMGRTRKAMATGAVRPVHPFVLVTTSVVEVGADLDADAMVCEQAPWPNLQQRLGRLGRDGRPATCIVLKTPPATEGGNAKAGNRKKREDNVDYDSVARDTFAALLAASGGRGFITWKTADQAPAGVKAQPSPQPWPLVDEAISWLALTGPLGQVTVDAEQIMAGVARSGVPEVGLVWREHLDTDSSIGDVRSCLAACPVLSHEVVAVPLSAARKGLGDIPTEKRSMIFLRRPNGEVRCFAGSKLRRGDQVLLPPSAGCYGAWGVDWTSTEPVRDVSAVPGGEDRQNPRAHFRLSVAQQIELAELTEQGVELPIAVGQVLGEVTDDLSLIDWSKATASLVADRWVFVSSGWDQRFDEAASCARPAMVSQSDHQADAAELVQKLAQSLGVKESELNSLVTGAAHHDEGKLDPRIQRAYGQRGSNPLAKSVVSRGHYRRMIQEQAMVGWRHEAVSDRLVSCSGDSLASHLAGATHGWSRPCYRVLPVKDTGITVSCPYCLPSQGVWSHNPDSTGDVHSLVGAGPSRFARLNQDYGPWGVAWMETLVRQSDWMASSAPRKNVPPPVHRPVQSLSSTACCHPRDAEAPFPAGWSVAGILAAYGTLFVYSEAHADAKLRFNARMPIFSGPLDTDDLGKLVSTYRDGLEDSLKEEKNHLISEGFVAVSEYKAIAQPITDRLQRLIVAQTTIVGRNFGLHRLALPISPRAGSRTLRAQLNGSQENRRGSPTPWGWDAEANCRSIGDLPAEEWHWLSFVGALLVPYSSSSKIALATWDEARDINAVIASLANPDATSTPVPLRYYQRTPGAPAEYIGWVIAT